MPTPQSFEELIRNAHPEALIFKVKIPGAPQLLLQKDALTQEPFTVSEYEIYKPTLPEVVTEITQKINDDSTAYIASFDPDPYPPYKAIVTYREPAVWSDGLQYQVSVTVRQCLEVRKAFSEKKIDMPLKPA